jgi:predicted KAP-like P-loop ATPase
MDNTPKKSKDKQHKFSADRPIASREEDLLGRGRFAESLASAIRGWKGEESLIIGLYGPWGSGKSSIKNLVLQSLRRDVTDCPLIVEFNPWQWAGQDKLAEAFFREIGFAFGQDDSGESAKRRAAKWLTYAATWKAGSFIAGGFRRIILSLLWILAVTGFLSGIPAGNWLKPAPITIGLLALVLLLLERFYGFIGTLNEKVASVFETGAEAARRNLGEQKEELSVLLQDLRNPILVVIDDVDRLSPDEIRLLFQLIKANADFPNLVYLVLFQRDIVERSLDSPPAIFGREFLEKIVQVGFDIPRIEQRRLEKVLFAGLDEILDAPNVSRLFDRKRWGNIYLGALRPYFETLRHVHRYLATLSFHVSLFRSTGSFEVNPIDLIGLEVLRVFEPDVFKKLPDAKRELTRIRNGARDSHEENERSRQLVESIVGGASRPEQVREIFKQIFLPVSWVFGQPAYGHDFEEGWFRELRLCHTDVFDRYFHFTIPEGDISQAELDRILSLVADREGLVAEFRILKNQGLLAIALDRLEAYKEKVDLGSAVPFVTALLDIGDELPDAPSGFSSISPDMHIVRIIYWFLKQEGDAGKRGQILKESMRISTGLYLPIRVASIESSEERRKKDPDAFSVPDADLTELHEICAGKIAEAANSDRLVTHSKMLEILYAWSRWDSADKPQRWVEKLVESRDGLLSFLIANLSRSTSHGVGDYVSEEHWRIRLDNMEKFIRVEILETKVAKLPTGDLTDKEQIAVKAFKKAIKRRQEGKPDSIWDDADEDKQG